MQRSEEVESTRQALRQPSFDPSQFIATRLSSIPMDSPSAETQLCSLFAQLSQHLSTLSESVEEEVKALQSDAAAMESQLLEELARQRERLLVVGEDVDALQYNFSSASEGAVSIGGKLSIFERERQQVSKSISLLAYIQEIEENPLRFKDVQRMNADKLKSILPGDMSNMQWDAISRVLHDLNLILCDSSASSSSVISYNNSYNSNNNSSATGGREKEREPRIVHAERIVVSITEVVETELLGQFDNLLDELLVDTTQTQGYAQRTQSQAHVEALLAQAKSLAETLHLFSHGSSLQKRYIFSVIQKRIPSDAFFTGTHTGAGSSSAGNYFLRDENSLVFKIKQSLGGGERDRQREDDESSAGASASDNDSEGEDGNSDNNNTDSEDNDGNNNNNDAVRSQRKKKTNNSNKNKTKNNSIRESLRQSITTQHAHTMSSSLQLIDLLSGLFAMINRVCLEQFELIRRVFPSHAIARVTRLLIQRIFSDPAFGIQARVDAILCPLPPAPPLSLAEYLDALLTVREKLTALNLLLLECTSDASMIGMGSEAASVRKAKQEGAYFRAHSDKSNGKSTSQSGRNNTQRALTTSTRSRRPFEKETDNDEALEDELDDSEGLEELNEERMRSDNEIREFFDEQIAQVLGNYVAEYFDKEITHVRQQYTAQLRKVVEESAIASSGSVLQIPHLKAEKMRSLSQISKSVTRSLVQSIFAITTDSVVRMESIGRDDKKKLPIYTKELCLLQMGVLLDGLLLPSLKQATNLLLKQASSLYKGGASSSLSAAPTSSSSGNANNTNSSTGTHTSSAISFDALDLLVVVGIFRERFSNNFENIFQRPLAEHPNLLVICKDARKKAFQSLVHHAKETLYAWEVGIVLFIEKTLASVQSRYDFMPKFDAVKEMGDNWHGQTAASLSPTAACDAICRTIISVTQAVRSREKDLDMFDLDNVYWRPLGQQFIAILIAHLRKLKISQSGSRQLFRDLEEYIHVAQLMNSAEALDMMVCLEEICRIFVVSANQVAKVVMEEMRHLDTAIVLALLRSRADFNTRQSDQYVRTLIATYSNFKWDAPLAWEGRKPLTVVAFNEAFSLILSGAASRRTSSLASAENQENYYIRMLGPRTLRKSSAMPLSALFLSDAMAANRSSALGEALKDSITISATGAMSIDIHALDAARNPYELDRQSRSVEVAQALKEKEAQQQREGDGTANRPRTRAQFSSSLTQSLVNKYLPSRPDEELDSRDREKERERTLSTQNASSAANASSAVAMQVSRPDLVGISSPVSSPRPLSVARTKRTTSTAVDMPSGGNPSNPPQWGNASTANNGFASAPVSAKTTKAEPKGGMLKSMTGFFKGF